MTHQPDPKNPSFDDDDFDLHETGIDDEAIDGVLDDIEEIEAEETYDPDADEGPDPADVIIALNKENTDLKNKVMTALADMENLRRRTEREVKDARQYAVANFARDMISVADNLGRAIQALPQEARDNADDAMKNLLEGVEMTGRDLDNQLSKNGVVQLEPEGEKFDPNFHQAMFEVPNTEVPNGTVVQVVQAGYKIGDRVLRPAMVGVSKGGPKVAAQPAPNPAEGEDGAPEAGSEVDKTV